MTNDNPLPVVTGNPDVIRVLEQALSAAKAGQVQGVAIILATGGDGVGVSMGGKNATALVAGCQQATRQLLDALFKPQQRSSILVPQRRLS